MTDLSTIERSLKPNSLVCSCGSPAAVVWRNERKSWRKQTRCPRCHHIWYRHGMTREDYNFYMSSGCAVNKCDEPATDIDHDHSICPQPEHSCYKCRRGPLCRRHNSLIIGMIEGILSGVFEAELDYLNLTVSWTKKGT